MNAVSVERDLPTEEARELVSLVGEVGRNELEPIAAEHERNGVFPRGAFTMLGRVGVLGLPYPAELGGAAQPFTVYLQVLEELAASWLTVALGVSVHTLSCHPLANFGTPDQQRKWLPEMTGGGLLGAYCLSEAHSGSDAAALSTSAHRTGDTYEISGTKAWITHGGEADFYTVMARTSGHGSRGISCFLVPADSAGLSFGAPERKMGMRGSTTAQVILDGVVVGADRRISDEGAGFRIAMAALDAGRLGISACAVGVAQAALNHASSYAKERQQFGRPIADFQGISFMLADMATQIEAARALYLSVAKRKDEGKPFSVQAAMSKMFSTDMCMQVTTDAVQILGGAGYVEDFPLERYMREAKVLQIVEGTNQIQRHLIGKSLS